MLGNPDAFPRSWRRTLLVGAIVLAGLPCTAAAAPGGLGPDPSFGTAGRALVGFPGPGSDDVGWAVAVQPDGKTVVVGGSETNGRSDMAFARYLPDGRLDPSFGSGGRATFDASGIGLDDCAFGLAIQPDGKLLVSGAAEIPSPFAYDSPSVAAVVRLLPDGHPDGAFGEGGLVLVRGIPERHTPQGFALALLPGGRFAVGGFANISGVVGPGQSAAFFLRFDADGRLDPLFGEEGRSIIRLSKDGAESVWGLAALADGKLVAAGGTRRGRGATFEQDLLVLRLDESGALDETFDDDGWATLDLTGPGGYEGASALAVQPDGKLVVAGAAGRSGAGALPPSALLARFDADGTIDTDFGEAGVARLSAPDAGRAAGLRSVVLLPDGRITAGGTLLARENSGGDSDIAVVRIDADGQPDASFGADGWRTFDASGSGADDAAYGLAAATDGGMLIAGAADQARQRSDLMLVHLTEGGDLDSVFGVGGLALTDFSLDRGTFDRAYAAVVQADGAVVVAGSANGQPAVARFAPDGRLDPVFGVNQLDPWGEAQAAALAPDGKIVLGGSTYSSDSDNLLVARMTADGRLDPSFGGYGLVALDVSGEDSIDFGRAVAVQPDGGIVLAGWTDADAGDDFVAVRFAADGQLDRRFGENGRAIVDTTGTAYPDHALALALDPTGKLVLVGAAYGYDDEKADLAMVRLNPDGSPDEDFGEAGRVVVDLAGDGGPDEGQAVTLLPDGRIVVAGMVGSGSDADIVLARFDPDGGLDTSFGADGVATLDVAAAGQSNVARSVVRQADGRLVVAGGSGLDTVVARFNEDGRPDAGFGQSGVLLTDVSGTGDPDSAFAVARAAGGDLVVAGFAASDFAVLRSTAAGMLDASFGTGGRVITNVALVSVTASARAIAIDDAGRLVLAGGAADDTSNDFAVARLGSAGSLDPTFGDGGRVITNFAPTGGLAYAAARQADGKLLVAGEVGGRIAAVRYLPDGALDTTFGQAGRVVLDVEGTARGAAVDDEGRITLAGSTESGNGDVAVVRLRADGGLDTTFGSDGSVTTGPAGGAGRDIGHALALQADGAVVVAGESGGRATVLRLLADGRPDSTFGQGGWLMVGAVGTGVQIERFRSVAMQTDGRVLLAGDAAAGTSRDFAVVRATVDGRLDTSFGAGGVVALDFGGADGIDSATAVAMQADGRIVVAGTADSDFALARLLPGGAPDTTLGPSGRLRTDVSGKGSIDLAYALALQPDGGIVVAGSSGKDFAALRYAPRAGTIYLPWAQGR